MVGLHPETRARWQAAGALNPVLFVDAHEMDSLDTYLFYPQADPHNPFLPARLDHWQHVFAADQAAAFDGQGWAYYTREWADAWAPFYSDAWGSLRGAIGILYEQASTAGFPLRDRAGLIRTYREAVHHQAISSLANLTTLAEHRSEVLADFLAHKRANVSADGEGTGRMLALVPGRHPTRERELLSLLVAQGVEVWITDETLEVVATDDGRGGPGERRELPVGSWLVPAAQPLRPLVQSYLAFDVRLDDAALLEERRKLEQEGASGLYDASAWSLPLMFDVDAVWCDAQPPSGTLAVDPELPVGGLGPLPADGAEPFAWIVDGADDASVAFAARALQSGLHVHLADKAFTSAGRSWSRGSLVVRRSENRTELPERVRRAARAAGVVAWPTSTGRSPDDGPDLGGGHFHLLRLPRVAMLSNMPAQPDTFGHLWYLLDRELGVPVSFLDAQSFARADLRSYNVIVVPPGSGWRRVLEPARSALASWVRQGGTLVGCGSGASALVGEALGLSSVVRRRDVLDDLEGYTFAARRQRGAREVTVDPAAIWGVPDGAESDESEDTDDETTPDPGTDPDKARQDQWLRRFSPAGVLLRGLVDTLSWITVGCDDELPVLVSGSTVLLARDPVAVPVRLAPATSLRLSGLLWPEARERIEGSAWLSVESVGHGQVVLFAGVPFHRGVFRGGGRLFANAVVYGSGVGADAPVDW